MVRRFCLATKCRSRPSSRRKFCSLSMRAFSRSVSCQLFCSGRPVNSRMNGSLTRSSGLAILWPSLANARTPSLSLDFARRSKRSELIWRSSSRTDHLDLEHSTS